MHAIDTLEHCSQVETVYVILDLVNQYEFRARLPNKTVCSYTRG